ncbi:MAG TPA: hypothetical protein VLA69_10840 [Gaiellaceae bacterium]|nr:hypothetical protein [Gaiellaceae bacterium]
MAARARRSLKNLDTAATNDLTLNAGTRRGGSSRAAVEHELGLAQIG